MTYELAAKLKDAGYSQPLKGESYEGAILEKFRQNQFEVQEPEYAYAPTLSELIEACGKLTMYFGLEKHSNDWRAGTLNTGGMKVMVSGSTPEDAVANLWLALNKKDGNS